MANKKINSESTDELVLRELGSRIAKKRLALEMTQAEMAREAGIAKRTLERIEAGKSAQMLNMIRVWRVLDLLPALDNLIAADALTPMNLLRHSISESKQQRKRARGRRSKKQDVENPDWQWADED